MSVFVNRVINLKKIKALGFDMDYTIVRYNSQAFEELTHQTTIKKLVELKGYPQEVLNFKFDYQRSLQGLVIDKKRGNLLKISRFGKVKFAYYGLEPLGFDKMTNTYRNRVIDLSINQFLSLDTAFSISNGVLFGQLVELKKKNTSLPDYETLADDIKEMIDVAHSDGSLKDQVKKNIKKFIIQDPNIAPLLENYKRHGKKLLVITNSDYTYSKLLLDYAINPFLKEHKHWSELFDITITLSKKPSFFTHKSGFLAINPKDGTMTNHEGPVTNGIYQGGFAGQLQEDLGLEGDEILYLGDHIYGDVVSLKKTFNWRTALVLDPLADEIKSIENSASIQKNIDIAMEKKEKLELKLIELEDYKFNNSDKSQKDEISKIYSQIDSKNKEISSQINAYKEHFNPYWGEMMRAGQEESRFADQVEKYACIYMTKIEDLLVHSPRTYFRPNRRDLPHES
tara:strand:- start:42142 stop:43503 length:1362 start_codon:yes stop_codon:yes gene_type:complete